MSIKEEFDHLMDKLKTERDEISLKLHLASLEAKQEFDEAEPKWNQLKSKGSEILDESVEISEEVIAKAKIVGEELKETYQRIAKRLTE
ncbi:MAG: hypothetical protein NTW85_12770 [Methylococcales bacterium]|nr:hypothetical protein [Methylococcales bacterium]